jgi:hypothetical protein
MYDCGKVERSMRIVRKIFVGSSSEAEPMANKVLGEQIERAGMELVKWRGIFQPSGYPLEVFERSLPQEVIGAILVATPDIFGQRTDARFASPVANVILEYGLLAARLGRSRVAICEFGDVTLPSDLEGLATVRGGIYEKDGRLALPQPASEQLQRWLQGLPHVAEQIPPIRQLHGYSGRWKVKSVFRRWRGRDLNDAEEVTFDGSTSMFIGVDGERGWGMQMGVLSVSFTGGYEASFRVSNEIVNVVLSPEGSLELTINVRHRYLIGKPKGTPPDDLGKDWLRDPESAPSFRIKLTPVSGRVKYLYGTHVYEPGKSPHQLADEDWNFLDL